jgi:hypothetical protein
MLLLLLVSAGQEGQVLDVLQLLLTLMRSGVGKHHALMKHFDELDGVRVILHTISASSSGV